MIMLITIMIMIIIVIIIIMAELLKSVMETMYVSVDMIPDTPSEPEPAAEPATAATTPV
jgi:hypothetical protein